ncbi:TIGR04222 domain-containing membrane protein [Streptomyces sp. NBC_01506]|uniref:TIGR04222 domain-containing membrane protein n=1 Tax=Streptomyces sp. NBC_01506 TaxID=2903887 RepID=UPI00386B698C
MRDPAAPMGLSSSALVVVFAVGLAALWVVTWFARRGVRHGAPPDPLPTLSTAELAYLHGGEYRLAEIELARLLSEGKLRISRPGMVVATRRETGLAGVLLDAAGQPARPGDLLSVAQRAPEMEPLVRRLRAEGLITSARRRALRWWGPQTLLAAWLVAGVAWLVSGARSGAGTWSVNGPVVVFVPEMVVGGLSFAMLCDDPGAFRTRAGTAIVRALRRTRENDAAPGDEVAALYGPLLRGPAGTVAVSGLSAYPDQEVRNALDNPHSQWAGGGP